MQQADELHFNMDGFIPPGAPKLRTSFGEPVDGYSNFEYSLMRTEHAEKSYFWNGDSPYTGTHPF